MSKMNAVSLARIQGGSWISELGGGICCGVAIGLAIESAGAAIPMAIGTCMWALG